MKQKIFSMIGAGLMVLAMSSCHEQSDTLMSYAHQDNLVFGNAEESFAGKFKVLWNGLNQNYALWDYEMAQGLDWDAVYDKYLPEFEALDKQEETVTNSQLEALVREVVCPLHDGHMVVKMKNHKSGDYVAVFPGLVRALAERPEYQVVNQTLPSMKYYANKANGQIELDDDGTSAYMEYSTDTEDFLSKFNDTENVGLDWINDSLTVLKNLITPTLEQLDMYQTLKTLKTELGYVKDTPSGISLFNTLANRYAYLNIPGFDPIDKSFCDNGMEIKAALLKGNIAYLYIDGFKLTRYMHDEVVKEAFPNPTAATQAHIENVKNVWKYWFDNIQYLHKAGTLGGVIIDVRNNAGGSMYDFNYLLGALLPSGGFEYGSVRYKRGTGRLDYSPLMPQVIYTMNEEHAIINEPIVVLANSCSVSMAEITSLCTKYIDNATLIGKRTFGGLCGLTGIENYSYYYAGHIGEEDKTPVYVYLPLMAQYNREGQILEGIGVTPDIEVDLDVRQLDLTGKDTQLDRALEFIRNGK